MTETKQIGRGHNLPPEILEERIRLNVPPVKVEGSENILDYPKEYRTDIERKAPLECCRATLEHRCSVYRTPTCHPDYPYDLFIAECKCGAKHRRVLAEPIMPTPGVVVVTHSFVKERR